MKLHTSKNLEDKQLLNCMSTELTQADFSFEKSACFMLFFVHSEDIHQSVIRLICKVKPLIITLSSVFHVQTTDPNLIQSEQALAWCQTPQDTPGGHSYNCGNHQKYNFHPFSFICPVLGNSRARPLCLLSWGEGKGTPGTGQSVNVEGKKS